MLKQIGESFVSKAKEKLLDYLVDYAQDNVLHANDYKLTLETLERKLNLLTSRASDVKEEIKNAEMSGKKKRKREVKNWLKEIKKKIKGEFRELEEAIQSQGFIGRFLDGDAAAKMNARVSELVEQSQHFREILLDKSCNGEALLMTKSVSSIGIYGMGGVGKTTLMKHVNNQLVDAKKSTFWVTVSQECSIMMLQDKIARELALNLSDEHNVDKRAARLNRAFFGRDNFVFILDDVWKKFSLEKVGDPLHVEGCTLILTTRSLEVCRQVGCEEIIEVETLNENESWNLFRETLGRGTELISLEVEEIAKSMAKMCDGLPLGIITIVGSMRGVTHNYVWRNALRELKESSFRHDDDEEDIVFKVLKYSFDRLDQRHQHCFLYFSLYPEDCEIVVEEIVSKFIVEELVDTKWSMQAQLDEGRAIVDKLVNVCLLESVRCGGVRMHDLLRAMALKITRGNLKALKELDLTRTCITEVPQGMEKLVNLKLLCMWGAHCLKMIPRDLLPNFPYLQCLHLPDHIQIPIEEVKSLKQLQEYDGRVEDMCEFNRFIRSQQILTNKWQGGTAEAVMKVDILRQILILLADIYRGKFRH
ncbi:hypothetical protein CDL12_20781 [Handroanthus impetiginosus]|uniref:NB-ARC domain-containing protein n=1 Tax=Handroanthus impetiginosus TaxID=429701 RepID=A0A2G9GN67_9LAMI|nr:hypothetical protein CDL12_20781 [Handroanthus impetiginosus]